MPIALCPFSASGTKVARYWKTGPGIHALFVEPDFKRWVGLGISMGFECEKPFTKGGNRIGHEFK